MHFLDLTLPTVAENLALDEALLLDREEGVAGEVLRLWEWPSPAVVLGAGCRLAEDVDEAACLADGVPILRRSSGGGTVLLGPGCLLFSLVLRYDRSPLLHEIRPSYAYILGRIRDALADLVPGLEIAGISDLALDGRKCSGNSQQRKRQGLLHHGTLLYDFYLERIGRYLRMPARQPEYRDGRTHAAFLTNLSVRRVELVRHLCAAWGTDEPLANWPSEQVRQLVRSKYAQANWIRRR
jgi:lipoate-protein ligase A